MAKIWLWLGLRLSFVFACVFSEWSNVSFGEDDDGSDPGEHSLTTS